MTGLNGIETAKKIRLFHTNVTIIFTTGIIDFMQQGYEVRAFRYLLKPIDSKFVLIHIDTQVYRTRGSIKNFEKDLEDKEFYRCHSHI